jgi:hypothetical protein
MHGQSERPEFIVQREKALALALRPYVGEAAIVPLEPLPEEAGLATLYVFADYFPDDGQLSLTEQVRDTISEHVPQEERAWLDPLRHSYQDVLEIVSIDADDRQTGLTLRSLGTQTVFRAQAGDFLAHCRPGQALLTRLLRLPERSVVCGAAILLSASNARAVVDAAHRWQREMEIEGGAFSLGDWEEFTKRYGYVLLWNVAYARLGDLLRTEQSLRYRTMAGAPMLHALALYEYDGSKAIEAGLAEFTELEREPSDEAPHRRATWAERRDRRAPESTNARLTLTAHQIWLECDSEDRLNGWKHRLASTFGFSLHFRGESIQVPRHILEEHDLAEEVSPVAAPVPVAPEEVIRLWAEFLETVYLDWADRPSPGLSGQTPRHAAVDAGGRPRVAALIDEFQANDPCRRLTGSEAFDYDRLRRQVGLRG